MEEQAQSTGGSWDFNQSASWSLSNAQFVFETDQ